MSTDSVATPSNYVGLKSFLFVVPVYPLMVIVSLLAIVLVWDGETDVDTAPMLLALGVASVVVLLLLVLLRLGLNRLVGFQIPVSAPFVVAAAAWFVAVVTAADIATYGRNLPAVFELLAALIALIGPFAVWIWWRLAAKKFDTPKEL